MANPAFAFAVALAVILTQSLSKGKDPEELTRPISLDPFCPYSLFLFLSLAWT